MSITNRFKHILLGWGRAFGFIKTSDYQAKLSKDRLEICGKCTNARYSKTLEFINGNAEFKHSLTCTKCWCPCLEKSLVPEEKCPENLW